MNHARLMYFWLRSNRIRRIIHSDLKKVQSLKSSSVVKNDNKVVLICISRNENQLLEQWVRHHSGLKVVCAIVLVDHLSTNPIHLETFERQELKDYHLYNFTNDNYFQAHVLNAVAADLIDDYDDAIFYPLDTDEFISEEMLKRIIASAEPCGYLDWRLAWPIDLFDSKEEEIELLENQAFRAMPNGYLGNKHFMRTSLLRNGYQWGQGAHELYSRLGYIRKGDKFGEMIHIPVRSYTQIRKKFGRGFAAHLDKALSGNDHEGDTIFVKHWRLRTDLLEKPSELLEDALKKYLPTESDLSQSSVLKWTDLFD
jgi:hypothetical protein